MVIIHRICNICSETLIANGSDNFYNIVNAHFKIKHPQEHTNLQKLAEDANLEFKELLEKYPELKFSMSYFEINYGHQTIKTGGKQDEKNK